MQDALSYSVVIKSGKCSLGSHECTHWLKSRPQLNQENIEDLSQYDPRRQMGREFVYLCISVSFCQFFKQIDSLAQGLKYHRN